VTFRLAARYCDEINLDVLPAETEEALRKVRRRCDEAGRDPESLAVSISVPPSLPWAGLRAIGNQRMMTADEVSFATSEQMARLFGTTRVDALQQWREQGLSRVTAGVPGLAVTDEPLYEFADDCRSAGLDLVESAGQADDSAVVGR
jgi:alkanesulfonate monooxygenase SsuD/methylene tetrahydromethanopterin reductase-like flavin-dependent oxidoreductase (luciferase family)